MIFRELPVPTGLRLVSDQVAVATDSIVRFGQAHVEWLKAAAQANTRQRARICGHRTNDDTVHEMLIAMTDRTYIAPHKHFGKSESFHVVEGLCDVVVFSDDGTIDQVIELGPPSSGASFFYRLDDSRFHTLRLRSPFLVIHEVTNGPFKPEGSTLANFAPSESDVVACQEWGRLLSQRIDAHPSRVAS
jgi:cupin fold WbuC family metalloprotein